MDRFNPPIKNKENEPPIKTKIKCLAISGWAFIAASLISFGSDSLYFDILVAEVIKRKKSWIRLQDWLSDVSFEVYSSKKFGNIPDFRHIFIAVILPDIILIIRPAGYLDGISGCSLAIRICGDFNSWSIHKNYDFKSMIY